MTPPPWPGQPGDGWIDEAENLWGWIEDPACPDGGYWHNYGPVRGPTGPAGAGSQAQSYNFAFLSSGLWASQTITHTLPSIAPSVRVLIDLDANGVYVASQTVHVAYPAIDQVVVTAEASIIQYNGPRGKLVLQ